MQQESSVVHISETPSHSCAVCVSPQYKQAEEIVKRSGLRPDYWGYLLHDIAGALINSHEQLSTQT